MWSQTLIPAVVPPPPRESHDNDHDNEKNSRSTRQPPQSQQQQHHQPPPPPTASSLFSPPHGAASRSAHSKAFHPQQPHSQQQQQQQQEEEDASALFQDNNDNDDDEEFEGGLESAVNLMSGMANALFQKTKDTVDTVKIVAQGPEALVVPSKQQQQLQLQPQPQPTTTTTKPPPIVTETSMLSSTTTTTMASSSSLGPPTTTAAMTTTSFPPPAAAAAAATTLAPQPMFVAPPVVVLAEEETKIPSGNVAPAAAAHRRPPQEMVEEKEEPVPPVVVPPPEVPATTTTKTTTTSFLPPSLPPTTTTTVVQPPPIMVAPSQEATLPLPSTLTAVPPSSSSSSATNKNTTTTTTAAQLLFAPPPVVEEQPVVVVPAVVPSAPVVVTSLAFPPPVTTTTTAADMFASPPTPQLAEEPMFAPTPPTPPVEPSTSTTLAPPPPTTDDRLASPPASPTPQQVVEEQPPVVVVPAPTAAADMFASPPTPQLAEEPPAPVVPQPFAPPVTATAADMNMFVPLPTPTIPVPAVASFAPPAAPVTTTTTTQTTTTATADNMFVAPPPPQQQQQVVAQEQPVVPASSTDTAAQMLAPKPPSPPLKLPTPTSNSNSTIKGNRMKLQGPPPRIPSPSTSSTHARRRGGGGGGASHHHHHHYPVPRPHLPLPPSGGGGSLRSSGSHGGSIGSAASNSTTTRQRRFGGFKVPPPTSIRTTTTTSTTTTDTTTTDTTTTIPPTTLSSSMTNTIQDSSTTTTSTTSQQLVNPTMIHTPSPSPTPYATPSEGLGMGSRSTVASFSDSIPTSLKAPPPSLPFEKESVVVPPRTDTTFTSPVDTVRTTTATAPPLPTEDVATTTTTTTTLTQEEDEEEEVSTQEDVPQQQQQQQQQQKQQAPEVELPVQTTTTAPITTKDDNSTTIGPSTTTRNSTVPSKEEHPEEQEQVGSPIVSSSSAVPMVQPPPLPQGWESMIDPTTSKTYYYHAQDHLTTWEHPQPPPHPTGSEGVSPVSTQRSTTTPTAAAAPPVLFPKSPREEEPPYVAPTSIISTATSTATAGQEETEEVNKEEEKEEPLPFPPELKEQEEESTPTEQEKEVLQEDNAVVDDNATKTIATASGGGDGGGEVTTTSDTNVGGGLPEGWEELVDPSSGNTYYYNVLENTTTWERPSVVVVESASTPATEETKEEEEEDPQQTEDDGIVTPEEEEQEVAEHEHTTEDSVLPEQTMTPEEEIYVQEETRDIAPEETSAMYGGGEEEEELPEHHVTTTPAEEEEVSAPPTRTAVTTETVQEVAVAPEVEMEDSSTTEMIEGAPPTEEEPSPQPEAVTEEVEEEVSTPQLPPGWVELVDPNSGNPYYFNEVENTTTWERPELPSPQQQQEEVVETETEEQPLEEVIEQQVEESNSPETEHETEQVETNDLDATTTSTTLAAVAAESPTTEDGEPPVVSIDDEPPEVNDTPEEEAASQEAVESSLEPEMSKGAESTTEEQSEVVPSALSAEGEESASLLPEGWVELVDPNSGIPYYFHETDNITTWEPPIREEAQEDPIALPSLMDAALNDEDDDDNKEEDETSQPELVQEDKIDQDNISPALEPMLPTDDVLSGEGPSDEPESHMEREVEQEAQTAEDAVEPELAEPMKKEESENENIVSEEQSSVFPTGWVELVDPTSGNPYYFNEVENITTWDPPVPTGPTAVPVTSKVGEEELKPTETKEESSPDLPEMEQEKVDFDEVPVQEESLPIDGDITGELDMGALDESAIVQEEAEQVATEATDEVENVEGDDKVEDAGEPSLPSGWIQLVDPSSGNPYYLNEAENITSWDPPTVDDAPEEDAAVDEMFEEDAKVASLPADESDATVPETEKEGTIDADPTLPTDEPEVAVQTDDLPVPKKLASNDDNYDNGLVLQEESEVAEIGEEVNSGVESAPRLPPGWVELIDPASGNPYYLHEADDVTTWDRPQVEREEGEEVKDEGSIEPIVEPMETEQDIDKAQSAEGLDQEEEPKKDEVPTVVEPEMEEISKAIETKEQDAEENVVRSDNAVTPLPPGWSKFIDPSSGDPYYLNEDKNITSWDFPVVEEVEIDGIVHEVDDAQEQPQVEDANPEDDISDKPSLDTGDEAQTGTEDANVEEESFGGEGNNALPPGWVELIDPSSGNPYYLHEADDVTTWERPILEDHVSKAEEKEHAQEDDEAAVEEDIVPDDLVPDANNKDDRPRSPQYRESVIMGWEEEPADEVADAHTDADEQPVDEVADAKADADEQLESDELPPGWVELIDPGSGNPYYLNEDENITTWEKPTLPQIEENTADNTSGGPSSEIQDELPSSDIDEVVASSSGEEMLRVAKSTDSVDMGQEVARDERSENDADEVAIQSKSETDAENEMPLPRGWVELIDPSSGQPYYLHEVDDITTWERPSILSESTPENIEKEEPHSSEIAEEIPVEAADESSPAEESEVDEFEVDEKQSKQANKNEDDNTDASQLPQGWVELIDPSSGNPYYLNEAEDITTWEKPTAFDSQSGDKTTEDKTEVTLPTKNTAEGTSVKEDHEDTDALLEKDNSKALPPGWVKLFDEGSGSPYYFNEVENRTSWDPPIGESEDSYEVTDVPSQSEGRDVAIDSTGDAVPSHTVLIAERSKNDNNLTGPLNSYKEEVVMSYIERKIYEKESKGDLLWQLVRIAVLSNGRLRSDEGVIDASGPEAAIVDLLLEDDYSQSVDCSGNTGEQASVDSSSLQSIQNLLLRGQREEGVEEALSSGNFAIALLVASMCDRGTFKKATLRYADDVLLSGSPLHTLAMLFSGQLKPPDASDLDGSSPSSSLWNCSPQQLSDTWRFHLAAIISNRIVGWDRIAIALGDKLRDSGNVQAAHFCYMVCGCPISSPEHSSTRIALVGCDHVISINTTLTTEESVDAFERTEAYEWAKQRGNPKAVIKSLQAFKIKYAAILADLGFVKEATSYLESLRRDMIGNENDLSALFELDKILIPCDHLGTSSKQTFVSVPKPAPNSCESWEKVETHETSVPTSPIRSGYVASMPVMAEGAQLASASGPPPVAQEKFVGNDEEEFTDANAGTFDDDDDETFLSARTAMTGTSTSVVTEKPAEKAKKPMFFNAAQIKEEVQHDLSPAIGHRVAPVAESSRVTQARTATTSGSRADVPPVMASSSQDGPPAGGPTFKSSVPPMQDGPPQTPTTMPSPIDGPPVFKATAITPKAEVPPTFPTTTPSASGGPPMFQAAMPSPAAAVGPPSGGSGMPPLAGTKSTTPLPAPAKADDKSFSTPFASKKEPGKPQQAPQSAPVPKAEKADAKDKPKKAPSSDTKQAPSSGGWGFGLTDWVTKKLNPDATKADLGDGMQAYYDEDKKVWVFPGEDPAEVAKPIAPPPTIAAAAPQPTPENKPAAAASNDPLAAMMAPPNLRGPSALKNRGSSGGRSYPGMASPGGGPPTMMMGGVGGSGNAAPPLMKMPSAPGGKNTAAAPPQFMVFQPKPGASADAKKTESKPQNDKEEPTEKGPH